LAIFYIPNTVIAASFDGWPTSIAFAASIIAHVTIALVTPPAPIRGLDMRLADDVDDALDESHDGEPDLVRVEAGRQ
jgi:SSS family solute:Na+ symporter